MERGCPENTALSVGHLKEVVSKPLKYINTTFNLHVYVIYYDLTTQKINYSKQALYRQVSTNSSNVKLVCINIIVVETTLYLRYILIISLFLQVCSINFLWISLISV